MNESMNAATKNIHSLRASEGMFERLCECNEHRESERFEVSVHALIVGVFESSKNGGNAIIIQVEGKQ